MCVCVTAEALHLNLQKWSIVFNINLVRAKLGDFHA